MTAKPATTNDNGGENTMPHVERGVQHHVAYVLANVLSFLGNGRQLHSLYEFNGVDLSPSVSLEAEVQNFNLC